MLGAQVTFEKFNVSLLGGSVEARGVAVAGDDPAVPLLTVARVKAEIAVGKAFKKEFVVKSLAVERPVLTIVRRADGTTNLPRPMRPDDGEAEPATASEDISREDEEAAAGDADDVDAADAPKGWRLEARQVLLVDGEVHFRNEGAGGPGGPGGGLHLSAEKITGEVKQADGGLEFTVIVDSLGRRDRPAELGSVKMNGTAQGVRDLSQWSSAKVQATLDVADGLLRASVHCPSLNPPQARADVSGAADLKTLLPFLPPGLALPAGLGAGGGRVQVQAKVSYDSSKGLHVAELNLRATDLIVAAGAHPATPG